MTNYIKDRISVVVCTYNHLRFIQDTIASVQSQEVDDLEIIVADDNSTDGAQKVIKEMADKDPRIKLVFSQTNGGISRNLNRGLEQVTGEFLATLGGDDLMLPGKLSKQLKFMKANPHIGLCCHDMDVFDSSTGNIIYRFNEKFDVPASIADNLFFTNWFFRKKEIKLSASSNFIRSEYYLQHFFDERLIYTNEMLHGILNYSKSPGYTFGFIHEVLGRYRIHANNITSKKKMYYAGLEEYFILHSIVVARCPELFSHVSNFVNFNFFRSILYKEFPLERRKAYEKVFLNRAGLFRYIYLKLCEIYLRLKGIY